jgi:hypothetical protein
MLYISRTFRENDALPKKNHLGKVIMNASSFLYRKRGAGGAFQFDTEDMHGVFLSASGSVLVRGELGRDLMSSTSSGHSLGVVDFGLGKAPR